MTTQSKRNAAGLPIENESTLKFPTCSRFLFRIFGYRMYDFVSVRGIPLAKNGILYLMMVKFKASLDFSVGLR